LAEQGGAGPSQSPNKMAKSLSQNSQTAAADACCDVFLRLCYQMQGQGCQTVFWHNMVVSAPPKMCKAEASVGDSMLQGSKQAAKLH